MIKLIKNYFIYNILNFIDKFLLFLLPLIVLKYLGEVTTYNTIEYIFSISAIIIIFLDIGMKNFLFYKLKIKKNSKNILEIIENNFIFYYFFFNLIIFFFYFLVIFFFHIENILIYFIIIKSLYLSLINYYKILFRAKNKPTKIFYFSILNSLLTIFFIIINFKFFYFPTIIIFFLSQTIFIIFYIFLKFNVILENFKKKKIISKIIFYKESFLFTFPLMVSICLYNFCINYGKIYSFNYLNQIEMSFIAFSQRIFLILTFFHASFVSFFQKKIYDDNYNLINKKRFLCYFFLIILINFFLILFFEKLSLFFKVKITDISLIYFLSLHSVIWCISSYLDMYLTKNNKNYFIMKYQIISISIFIIFMFLLKKVFLVTYLASLLISSMVYLLLIITKLNKMKFVLK